MSRFHFDKEVLAEGFWFSNKDATHDVYAYIQQRRLQDFKFRLLDTR